MKDLKYIGLLLFDGVEELDAVGPWEVISWWTRNHPEDGYRIITVADDLGAVTCAQGLRMLPENRLDQSPAFEVLIYPGGRGTRAHLTDRVRLDWVRAQRASVPLMTSVCTGALVYAAAGILHERPATTHWGSLDLLSSLDPTITVRPDDRFVDDGDTITSSGVSAGIDMALHLVSRLAGPDRGREARRGIQYDPPAASTKEP
ncbi:DJ-1/PfpI family protein [Parafrigoribacterium mesophilum]|uniref:DJ-1/PfpI family protein n=1 Tax=Parafrigoribacterium mesophilum TaxID=433646 RepID=UPI0031FDE3BB